MVEEHRLRGLRPREMEIGHDSIFFINSILQRSLIESHRRKLRQARMHPILNLQPNGPDSQADQPLEQRLVQARFCCFLAHDNWA